ncbi:MAG: dynamin family protein [Zoogloeaceae bacterium]|jgi:hypothetical protein|nr:dynamin family protein [Zoogloeaceae bacterium]
MSLALQFAAYSQWRQAIIAVVKRLRQWLDAQELGNAQTELRLQRLEARIREDRLNVAFVAEFSRGKSELINSIFFSAYGDRILPSAAGRTTMCPTELLFNADEAPSIRLLSIDTRRANISVSEYKRQIEEWRVLNLDVHSAESMRDALRQVSEVMKVTPEDARELGFLTDDAESNGFFTLDEQGLLEVPRWRHAIINFPHPLLQQGLVILDTPGLNAVGAEPELTLSLLPNAHAVLFILAADVGVTQSDLVVWNEHIGGHLAKRGRIVVLNKIDGLWDELKSEAEIQAEIERQAENCARILSLERARIFPVSAQKGLVAKINHDDDLLGRSRLPELENALSEELIPAKHDIVSEDTQREFGEICRNVRELLEARLHGVREQLNELNDLRGKNRSVVEYMMGKIKSEKTDFESGLQHYHAVRSVFSTLTKKLFAHLGMDALRALIRAHKETMQDAKFSRQLSENIEGFFAIVNEKLKDAAAEIGEIHAMMEAVYKRLDVEHGVKLSMPASFSLQTYLHDVKRLHAWCDAHLNTALTLLTNEKKSIVRRFFSEITVQAQKIFERANWEAESWLKIIMAPMETQIREHQLYLKRRLESIKRIHLASDTLEERIAELEMLRQDIERQAGELREIGAELRELLRVNPPVFPEEGNQEFIAPKAAPRAARHAPSLARA